MSETNSIILNMIKDNKSVEEISKVTNLSHRQIYIRIANLENKGYVVNRFYNTDGTISYTFDNSKGFYKDGTFELENTKKDLKFMLISDMHIGNIRNDEKALNTIYDYCIKNNINVILNCGDIVDGTFSKGEIIIDPEEQIEHLINIYPFDKSIFTLYTSGDHDYSLYRSKNLSLSRALMKRRHDIKCINKKGDDCSNDLIHINNNYILVSHRYMESKNNNAKLHLLGHSHTSKLVLDNEMKIYIPPLSLLDIKDEIDQSRAIELDIRLGKKDEFETIIKRDLLVMNDRTYKTNETILDFNNYRFVDSAKKKEFGELSNDQQGMLNEFFSSKQNDALTKKINKELKGKGKKKWQ